MSFFRFHTEIAKEIAEFLASPHSLVAQTALLSRGLLFVDVQHLPEALGPTFEILSQIYSRPYPISQGVFFFVIKKTPFLVT